jgi:hypothetical protein
MKRMTRNVVAALALLVMAPNVSWCDGGAPAPMCFPGQCPPKAQ